MLRKLRREFIAITMAVAGVVLLLALGSSLYTTASSLYDSTAEALEEALEDSDPFTFNIGAGVGGRASDELVVVLELDADGTVLSSSSTTGVTATAEMLAEVIPQALASTDSTGHDSTWHVAWLLSESPIGSGYRLAICDTYSRDSQIQEQLLADVAIMAAAMVALYFLVCRLADWALRPVSEAWEQQRRFVSDASHELKTPLAVILANTQILEDDRDMPDSARRWVDSTAEEAEHMKALVEDLLTLARADEREAEGAGTVVREDVDLTELVEGCTMEFDAVAFERGALIDCECEPGLHVEGDRTQLQRLVRTLLDNATKYAEPDSAVRVRLARAGKHVRLTVNNKGDVIAPEDLEHLFDRFYRTDSARERQEHGGFGLGLAIAKSIAEAHGGTIRAESTAEAGTTFIVEL